MLAGEAILETGAYAKASESLVALAGFPSFGEFGPEKSSSGYSHPMFHNMTTILVLLGSTNE